MEEITPDERRQLNDLIETHPGRLASQRWESLLRVHKVLQANTDELLALVTRAETDSELGIELMQNVRDTAIKEQFYDELIRLSHNYLSALKMLVDHTRNLMRFYESQPVYADYNRRKQTVIEGGRAPFLQKLRDYLIHYKIPPLGLSFQLSDPMTTTVFIGRDTALEYRDWPTSARTWLREQPKQIPFKQLIFAYSADLEILYRWLYAQFTELHEKDIAEVNELITRMQGAANTRGHPDYAEPSLEPRDEGGA